LVGKLGDPLKYQYTAGRQAVTITVCKTITFVSLHTSHLKAIYAGVYQNLFPMLVRSYRWGQEVSTENTSFYFSLACSQFAYSKAQ